MPEAESLVVLNERWPRPTNEQILRSYQQSHAEAVEKAEAAEATFRRTNTAKSDYDRKVFLAEADHWARMIRQTRAQIEALNRRAGPARSAQAELGGGCG